MPADHDPAVYSADDLRNRGEINWDQYKTLLKGKFVRSAEKLMQEVATRVRDRDGRRRDLQDLGGR